MIANIGFKQLFFQILYRSSQPGLYRFRTGAQSAVDSGNPLLDLFKSGMKFLPFLIQIQPVIRMSGYIFSLQHIGWQEYLSEIKVKARKLVGDRTIRYYC